MLSSDKLGRPTSFKLLNMTLYCNWANPPQWLGGFRRVVRVGWKEIWVCAAALQHPHVDPATCVMSACVPVFQIGVDRKVNEALVT